MLDFTIAYSGPLCAMMLGDMGADVIKIERLQGESVRRGKAAGMDELDRTETADYPDAAQWLAINRSKRSLAIDLGDKQGLEITLKLTKGADVLVESFRPSVMGKLGLGYEAVSKVNPGIIYASLSGFGEAGPWARRVGGDMYAQAMGGVVARQGNQNGPPSLVGFNFVDQSTAAIMAFGIMAALFERQSTGCGQRITCNLLHSVIHMQSVEASEYLIDGELVTKVGRGLAGFVPGGAYRAKDGDVVTIFGTGLYWPKFCEVLGIMELEQDPRFNTDKKRNEHREELYPLLDDAFSMKTRTEWQEAFKKAGMRCDPCLNYQELFDHPQVEANGVVTSIEHPDRGKIKLIAPPVIMHRTPATIEKPPPLLGQHTEEILVELGYSIEDISNLSRAGVINCR